MVRATLSEMLRVGRQVDRVVKHSTAAPAHLDASSRELLGAGGFSSRAVRNVGVWHRERERY